MVEVSPPAITTLWTTSRNFSPVVRVTVERTVEARKASNAGALTGRIHSSLNTNASIANA